MIIQTVVASRIACQCTNQPCKCHLTIGLEGTWSLGKHRATVAITQADNVTSEVIFTANGLRELAADAIAFAERLEQEVATNEG